MNFTPGVLDLRQLVRQLFRFSWLIIVMAIGFGVLAFMFSVRPAPYEVHATVGIDPASTKATTLAINDIDIEMGRIRSWTTVERVLDSIPFYGFVSLRSTPQDLSKVEKIKSFMKTGKKHDELSGMPIQIEALNLPEEFENVRLSLEVLPDDGYRVTYPDGAILTEGKAGEENSMGLGIFHVSAVNASVGSIFDIRPVSKDMMIERVLTAFKIRKRTTNKNASLIDFTFFSNDPSFALTFIDRIIADYVGSSFTRLRQSKQMALDDLSADLEGLKQGLQSSEEVLSEYMQSLDVADVNAEMRGQLELRLSLEQTLRDIQLQKAQLRQTYTSQHPAMKAILEKESKIQVKLDRISRRLEELPEIKGRLYSLTRAVEQQSREYELLLEQMTALKLEASALSNPASVINEPRIVRRNLRNKTFQVVVLGGMMGGIIAFCFIVLYTNLHANLLERARQLPTYPALSVSEEMLDDPQSAIAEIVSQLSYITRRKKGNIAIFTSPQKGKTASHVALSVVREFSAQHGKVLLIDANLKKSHLAEITESVERQGLANIMAGNALSSDIIKPLNQKGLYYMPPGNPAMSVMILRDYERLDYILAELSKLFSCIVIDLPSQQELPFWGELLNKASLVVHLLEKNSPLHKAKYYMQMANTIAEQEASTLHEAMLYLPKFKDV